MIKILMNFESVFLQTNVRVTIALPYPNLVHKDIGNTLVTLHCALKSGEHFFDELGIGYYVDRCNTAIISPDLGNSFFVDNNYQSVGFFLRNELLPYLKRTLAIPKEREHTFCLGISMGAYGAANWALSEDCFSKVFLLSGIYDYLQERDKRVKNDRMLNNLARVVSSLKEILFKEKDIYHKGCDLNELLKTHKDSNTSFHMYCGSEDYLSLEQTKSFYQKLQESNIPSTLSLTSGSHDCDFWKSALAQVFSERCFSLG